VRERPDQWFWTHKPLAAEAYIRRWKTKGRAANWGRTGDPAPSLIFWIAFTHRA